MLKCSKFIQVAMWNQDPKFHVHGHKCPTSNQPSMLCSNVHQYHVLIVLFDAKASRKYTSLFNIQQTAAPTTKNKYWPATHIKPLNTNTIYMFLKDILMLLRRKREASSVSIYHMHIKTRIIKYIFKNAIAIQNSNS